MSKDLINVQNNINHYYHQLSHTYTMLGKVEYLPRRLPETIMDILCSVAIKLLMSFGA